MGLSLHQLCLQQNRYLRLCGQWQNRPQAFQVQFPLRTQTQSKGDHSSCNPACPSVPPFHKHLHRQESLTRPSPHTCSRGCEGWHAVLAQGKTARLAQERPTLPKHPRAKTTQGFLSFLVPGSYFSILSQDNEIS